MNILVPSSVVPVIIIVRVPGPCRWSCRHRSWNPTTFTTSYNTLLIYILCHPLYVLLRRQPTALLTRLTRNFNRVYSIWELNWEEFFWVEKNEWFFHICSCDTFVLKTKTEPLSPLLKLREKLSVLQHETHAGSYLIICFISRCHIHRNLPSTAPSSRRSLHRFLPPFLLSMEWTR